VAQFLAAAVYLRRMPGPEPSIAMAELGYRVTPLGVAFHRGLTNL